ncbi:hypothetical protein CsatB_018511 [Cannabis sativa]
MCFGFKGIVVGVAVLRVLFVSGFLHCSTKKAGSKMNEEFWGMHVKLHCRLYQSIDWYK